VRRANLGRGFEDTAIYRGPELRSGDTVRAPAVIEETFTTIAVYPGWEAVVDDAGDYLLTRVE
jgi:N-methylhydantoinase A